MTGFGSAHGMTIASTMAYLDRSHICVLGNVLVLVKPVFCRFAFPEVDTEFHEQDHDRFQRADRAVPGSLGRDMFVEKRQGGGRLPNRDELLCSL